MVNKLICETLHPTNIIAKLYNSDYTDEVKHNIIVMLNEQPRINLPFTIKL